MTSLHTTSELRFSGTSYFLLLVIPIILNFPFCPPNREAMKGCGIQYPIVQMFPTWILMIQTLVINFIQLTHFLNCCEQNWNKILLSVHWNNFPVTSQMLLCAQLRNCSHLHQSDSGFHIWSTRVVRAFKGWYAKLRCDRSCSLVAQMSTNPKVLLDLLVGGWIGTSCVSFNSGFLHVALQYIPPLLGVRF